MSCHLSHAMSDLSCIEQSCETDHGSWIMPHPTCQALPSVVTQAASFQSDVSTRVRALNMLTGLSNANWDGSDTYSSDAQSQPITNLPNLPNSQSDG